MGWYLRKSITRGPMRINMSKSGIGWSIGLKGARISFGPRGTYINAGRDGIYFRKRLDQSGQYNMHGKSYTQSEAYQSERGMPNAADDSAIKRVNARMIRRRWWPLIVCITLYDLIFLSSSHPNQGIVTFCAGFALTVCIWFIDRHRRRTRLTFAPLDYAPGYQIASSACAELATAQRVWHVLSRSDTHDQKRNAGAATLLRRERVRVGQVNPPYIRTNISVWGLSHKGFGLYFFPDRALLYHDKHYTSLPYASLGATAVSTRFIESEQPPRDGEVVDTTWRYVNKDGGPDRRFTSNRQLPVMRYAEVRLTSSVGLAMTFQVSRIAAGEHACSTFGRLAHFSEQANAREQKKGPNEGQTRKERSHGGGQSQAGKSEYGRSADPRAHAYAVLGLAPGASYDQIKNAFHTLAQQYHPDKVPPHLGPEFKKLAEQKMKDLVAAYETLMSASG